MLFLLLFKLYLFAFVNQEFVPLFVFIVEIVMKVSNNETVLLLKKKVNYEDFYKHLLELYLLLSSTHTNTHTHTRTHTYTHTHTVHTHQANLSV